MEDGIDTINPADLNNSPIPRSSSETPSKSLKRSRSPPPLLDQYSAQSWQDNDAHKPKKRGRPAKSKHPDSPTAATTPNHKHSNSISHSDSKSLADEAPQDSPAKQSPSATVNSTSVKSVPNNTSTAATTTNTTNNNTTTATTTTTASAATTANNTAGREHTTDELVPEGDEYVDREIDEEGEKKVMPTGHLSGGREYRCRTFFVPNRGKKLFMLATECARVLNYRDSYLLFNKNKSLVKIIASQPEKDDLIQQEILPYSYRSRQIAIVSARSMYRQFGARMIVDGRRVRDDYWEAKAIKQGFTEEDFATEVKKPAVPQKPKETTGTDISSTGAVAMEALQRAKIVYQDDPNGFVDLPHIQGIPVSMFPFEDQIVPDDLLSRDYGIVQLPRQDITGTPYEDRNQASTDAEIVNQAAQAMQFNMALKQERLVRQEYFQDFFTKPRPADIPLPPDPVLNDKIMAELKEVPKKPVSPKKVKPRPAVQQAGQKPAQAAVAAQGQQPGQRPQAPLSAQQKQQLLQKQQQQQRQQQMQKDQQTGASQQPQQAKQGQPPQQRFQQQQAQKQPPVNMQQQQAQQQQQQRLSQQQQHQQHLQLQLQQQRQQHQQNQQRPQNQHLQHPQPSQLQAQQRTPQQNQQRQQLTPQQQQQAQKQQQQRQQHSPQQNQQQQAQAQAQAQQHLQSGQQPQQHPQAQQQQRRPTPQQQQQQQQQHAAQQQHFQGQQQQAMQQQQQNQQTQHASPTPQQMRNNQAAMAMAGQKQMMQQHPQAMAQMANSQFMRGGPHQQNMQQSPVQNMPMSMPPQGMTPQAMQQRAQNFNYVQGQQNPMFFQQNAMWAQQQGQQQSQQQQQGQQGQHMSPFAGMPQQQQSPHPHQSPHHPPPQMQQHAMGQMSNAAAMAAFQNMGGMPQGYPQMRGAMFPQNMNPQQFMHQSNPMQQQGTMGWTPPPNMGQPQQGWQGY